MTAKPIAYIQASWHTDITDHCKQAFMTEVAKHGYQPDTVELFSAPGSLEIPLMAKKLAKSGRYAAVCASGFVVDGGIYRHEFVAHAVLQGLVQASLETEVPSSPRCSPRITFTITPSTRSSSRHTCRGEGPGAGRGLYVHHRDAHRHRSAPVKDDTVELEVGCAEKCRAG